MDLATIGGGLTPVAFLRSRGKSGWVNGDFDDAQAHRPADLGANHAEALASHPFQRAVASIAKEVNGQAAPRTRGPFTQALGMA